MRAILRPYKAKPETSIEKAKKAAPYKYINIKLWRLGTERQEKRTRISYFGYEIRMAQNKLGWRQWLFEMKWLENNRPPIFEPEIKGGLFMRMAGIEFMPATLYKYKFDTKGNDKCLI